MTRNTEGWINGFLGMLIFSGSLPATRLAVAAFDPLFLTVARAAIAGLLALAVLAVFARRRPPLALAGPLSVVALAVVAGFPLLTALALRHVPAAHAMVFIGLLPLSTALFGVWRGGERPRPAFWLFAGGGGLLVAGFAVAGTGFAGLAPGDGLMLAAIAVCGLGYAEGARLARLLGGWQVICWALVLSLPAALAALALLWPADLSAGLPAVLALGYVSLFSMLIGFFFWYRGLALGGIAGVGQLQLLQPFFGLGLAALLLGETVGWPVLAVTAAVMLCVAAARRFAR